MAEGSPVARFLVRATGVRELKDAIKAHGYHDHRSRSMRQHESSQDSSAAGTVLGG